MMVLGIHGLIHVFGFAKAFGIYGKFHPMNIQYNISDYKMDK
jgi:hypothetical protein